MSRERDTGTPAGGEDAAPKAAGAGAAGRGDDGPRQLLARTQLERDRLAALIASIQDEIWFADTARRFTLANPQARREFALPVSPDVDVEAFAASLEVLRPDGSPRPVEEAPALRALRGEVVSDEEEVIRTPATGELRWRQVSAAPVRDASGAIVGSVSVARDVTDRRRAEEALREAEARIRNVLNNLPRTMVYQVEARADGTRRFTYVSQAVTALFGCTPEEALEDASRIYGAFLEEDRARVARDEERALEDLSPFAAEFRVRTPSGPPFWVYATSAPRRRRDGSIVWDGVAVDVSERKRVEAALIEANERLRESDRHKDRFLAMLSHELRNPLAPIRSSLDVLDRAPPGGEQAARARAILDRQVTHLTALVNDLLDLTRLTNGQIQLQHDRVDLCEVVQRTAEDHRALFAEAGVELELRPPAGELRVRGDRVRLAQIAGNLLQNAAKFTPPGGKATVTLEADPDRGHAVLTVRDTGAGMTPELLRHLFEPFTQGDQSLDRQRGGLGLGLALVKWLVQLHGGEVSARSPGAGRGSELAVRLPLERARPAVPDRPAAGPAQGRRRILVIEDNVDAAESLRDLVELGGHDVAVAYDGPAGLARARERRPDLVLCDIGLPGMDGYAVARAFRADPALAGVRLVALSGYALPDDLRRAAEAGFERHLAKPPTIEELATVLGGDPGR